MKEIWKDIKNFEGKYQISNYGRLKSVSKNNILKPMIATNGYLMACLWKDGKQHKLLIHRLVALNFLPKVDGLNEINHLDENKTNNVVTNLEWCTHRYNMYYGSTIDKIRIAATGRITSEETKQKLSIDTSRKRWINNGIIEKYVYVETLEKWLSQPEWKKGRKSRRR